MTHESSNDVEGDENATEYRLASEVTVPHCRHGNKSHVHTLPVRQALRVVETNERVTSRLHLKLLKHVNSIIKTTSIYDVLEWLDVPGE